jgi:exonuclease III
MSLKITSINIERSRHLQRLEAFITAQQPDVLCLQELCERDVPFFENIIHGHLGYTPRVLYPSEEALHPNGNGIFCNRPMRDVRICDYYGNEKLPSLTTEHHDRIIFATVDDAEGNSYRIATTHVRVTEKGASTPAQQEAVANLIEVALEEADKHGGLFLVGDFNAPRGRASFDMLARVFVDGVPPQYVMSLDRNLHKDGKTMQDFMVDGLFHTPNYKLENATLHTGVSDHCALTATLSRKE